MLWKHCLSLCIGLSRYLELGLGATQKPAKRPEPCVWPVIRSTFLFNSCMYHSSRTKEVPARLPVSSASYGPGSRKMCHHNGRRVIYVEEWQEESWTQETRHFGKTVPLASLDALNGIRVGCHLPAITKVKYERPCNSTVLRRTIKHVPSQTGMRAIRGSAEGLFLKFLKGANGPHLL